MRFSQTIWPNLFIFDEGGRSFWLRLVALEESLDSTDFQPAAAEIICDGEIKIFQTPTNSNRLESHSLKVASQSLAINDYPQQVSVPKLFSLPISGEPMAVQLSQSPKPCASGDECSSSETDKN
jgi:hypothetical protein